VSRPAQWRHIAIEGPIGVGKSSLARKLAAHLGAELLLEKPEENPFLARFYEGGAEGGSVGGHRYALQTQLFFLFQRIEQYRALAQPGMFTPRIVSDFMFAKDALFARLTLSDDEYRLYRQIEQHASPPQPRPDVVIWLRAEPATLLQRIRQRGIAMERGIGAGYLQRLADAYAEHFERERDVPVIAVDTDDFNPLANPAHFARLLDRLAAEGESGGAGEV
jgi:deoxyadenosine/deoxycytidine kinase